MFYDQVKEAADAVGRLTGRRSETGIILGSGLGPVVDTMEDKIEIPYGEIPHFPISHVEGHAEKLVFGKAGGREVVAMQGRFHYYEGFTMKELTFPVYVLKLLGVKKLIVTNACGAINQSFHVGDLVLLTDYINFLGDNSLIGENDERFGPRFPDMTEAFSQELRAKAAECAKSLGIEYREGVYALFNGPCFETAAEIRALSVLGADCVGMSTVPEVIAANYLGMKILGISCITNMATGIAKEKHDHREVLRIANVSSGKLCAWVSEILKSDTL